MYNNFFRIIGNRKVCICFLQKFTLLELLCIIGVLVILMSLMLPSLAKARCLVKDIGCSNNIRSLGVAVAMYSGDQGGWCPGVTVVYSGGSGVSSSGYYWDYLLKDYVGYDYSLINSRNEFSVFHCPRAMPCPFYKRYRSRGYAMNNYLMTPDLYNTRDTANFSRVKRPSETLCISDTAWDQWNTASSYEAYTSPHSIGGSIIVNDAFDAFTMDYRHSNNLNVLFMDVHVSSCKRGLINSYGYAIPKGTRWRNNGTLY